MHVLKIFIYWNESENTDNECLHRFVKLMKYYSVASLDFLWRQFFGNLMFCSLFSVKMRNGPASGLSAVTNFTTLSRGGRRWKFQIKYAVTIYLWPSIIYSQYCTMLTILGLTSLNLFGLVENSKNSISQLFCRFLNETLFTSSYCVSDDGQSETRTSMKYYIEKPLSMLWSLSDTF